MTARTHWNGVRMRTAQVTATPDDDVICNVVLPADWDDDSAIGLLQLAPAPRANSVNPRRSTRLANMAARWIDELDSQTIPTRSLSCMLLLRQAAPGESLWLGQHDRRPSFIVNLAAFARAGEGFATESFVACLRLACTTLRAVSCDKASLLNGELPLFDAVPANISTKRAGKSAAKPDTQLPDARIAPAGDLLLTNLDSCLANLGLDYDSEAGRDTACCLAALATLVAHAGSGSHTVPLPPARSVVPGLATIARSIWRDAAIDNGTPLPPVETGFSAPGPVDMLLGVEACGLAPLFSPLRADGRLCESTLARLAHRGLTPTAALAHALAGEQILPLAGVASHQAMHRALCGFVDHMPARPDIAQIPLRARRVTERGAHRALPARHGGFTQKTNIGGHKLFLRTGEYEDGSLGEISLTPARESPMVRGLMDSIGQAVSIGLQYGAPLEAFVSTFAYTRFGPGGTVEGDPVAAYATSLLDYAFRALSDAYLDKRLPDAPHQENASPDPAPLLPLDFPQTEPERRRAKLRLVS